MDDKIKINLRMADNIYPLEIRPSEEEIVRKAAKQVDTRLQQYELFYKEVSREQLLAMTAWQFAQESLMQNERNDTQPYTDEIRKLIKLLEDYLDEQEA